MAGGNDSTDKLINVQLQQLAAQVANWAAQLDFAKERFRLLELPEFQAKSQLEIDRLAFEKAQDTWKRAFQESSLSGTYNGQPTIEWLTQQAQLTGVLNGQQTLQGKLTDAQIGQMNEQMRLANEQFLVNTTGYHQGRPTFEREQFATQQTGYYDGQSTLARQQMEAELSGYFGGRQTLEREKFGADQTQNYLQLLSSLQGPGNAFKQMRVLGATPENLQNLVSGWAGTYNMPGFGSSGAPGQAQISDLWAGMQGGMGQQGGGGGQPGGPPGSPGAPGAAPIPPGGAGAGGATGPPGMPGQWSQMNWTPGSAPTWGAPPQSPGMQAMQAGGIYTPPAAVQQMLPQYYGPQGPVPPGSNERIPGRGFTPAQWSPATRAEVAAWNAAHPGFLADGSQTGYSADPAYGATTAYTPEEATTSTTGVPLSSAELNEYETILESEANTLANGQPSILGAGSAFAARLTEFLNRGAQRQSATPIPGSAQAIADAAQWQQAIAASGPFNAGVAAGRPPSATAFTWAGQQAAPPAGQNVPAPPQAPWAPAQTNSAFGQQAYNQFAQQFGQQYGQYAQAATNGVNIPGYTFSPQGAQAPPGSYNYSATNQGHTQVYPPGVQAPPNQEQVSTQAPINNSTANSLLAHPMPGMGGSLSPSQINAENYANMNDYAKEFMWGWFENQGWDPQAAKSEFQRSLPKYSGPTQGRVQL